MGLLNGDWVSVNFGGRIFGQRTILTSWWRAASDFGVKTIPQDLDDILNEFSAAGSTTFVTKLRAAMPPQWTLEYIRAQRVRPTRSAYREAGYALPGTNADAATTGVDTVAVLYKGDNAGRSNISVKKFGPVPDAASAAGLVTAAYKLILNPAADQLGLAVQVGGVGGPFITPIVPHKDGVTFEAITQVAVQATSRCMTRRTVGRGE